VYRWAERAKADEIWSALHHNSTSCTLDPVRRLQQATSDWRQAGAGAPPKPPAGEQSASGRSASAPALGDLDRCLKRISSNKAVVADGWLPPEIAQLPKAFRLQLVELLNRCEEAGRWGLGQRATLIVMLPKPKATRESDLRPIGILPCLYRVWAWIRRRRLGDWTTTLCRDQPLSTLQLGLEAGLALERAAESKHIGVVVLLGCSKFYEHVGQDLALRLALNYGCPPRVASLALLPTGRNAGSGWMVQSATVPTPCPATSQAVGSLKTSSGCTSSRRGSSN
jgi:hypothetical protein